MAQQCRDSDLLILPEMWSTGFITGDNSLAEDEGESMTDGSLAWMRKTAAELDAAVSGSLAIRTAGGRCVNRMYFAMPDGTLEHYDKRHLFSYGGEDRSFCPGTERKTVEFRGVRFLLQVCYDLRFPVWSRCRGDYDAIVYVANWPASRHPAWETLLRARAIENQCYVAGVNRAGSDSMCRYGGGSIVVDPYGNIIAGCGDGQAAASAEIDPLRTKLFREKFPALGDADKFEISI